jgi:phosphoribosylaminoimidazolecarboxamide formyltransferase/IMP cyclohydrolase
VLAEAGLRPIQVSDVTGFPEMMDGRVKTLHPMVHGGILARRSSPDHLASAARHGITLIDIVVVNLYPFARASADPDTPVPALVEEIDIGGPSLVRGAAKNFEAVLVVVSPADYETVLVELDRPGGPAPAFRLELARKAFAHTGQYDATIAETLAQVVAAEEGLVRTPARSPVPRLTAFSKLGDLRYGENPHQRAAWYAEADAGAFGAAAVVQGKALSYTNLLDLDAAARIVGEFREPAAAVVKHTNPCGAATGASGVEAYVRARDADAMAAYGGIVALNRPIDRETATALASTFIEAVVAPGIVDEAAPVLARKTGMRVLVADMSAGGRGASLDLRSILGALLVQDSDRVEEAAEPWPSGELRVVTRRQPTAEEWMALRFAWRIVAHVKSNAVIFTSSDRTLAVGAGQMSRVDAVRVARMKAADAKVSLAGSVAASDAFFPFRDGLDALAEAGATAVVQPGGSVRDAEVIAAADEHGVAMVFTARRHFRH